MISHSRIARDKLTNIVLLIYGIKNFLFITMMKAVFRPEAELTQN